jgi:hypothetical protein
MRNSIEVVAVVGQLCIFEGSIIPSEMAKGDINIYY